MKYAPATILNNCKISRHICDGIINCPNRNDEFSCENYTCSTLLKCTVSSEKVCIHPVHVCDTVIDCPEGEDELACDAVENCPQLCECILFAVKCIDTEYVALKIAAFYLNFTNVQIADQIQQVVSNLDNGINKVYFIGCSLDQLYCDNQVFQNLSRLCLLDLSKNRVSFLGSECFTGLDSLQTLSLSENEISLIHDFTFVGLFHLKLLDLSRNKLTQFRVIAFVNLSLNLLNVKENDFDSIDPQISNRFGVRSLDVSDYRFCCLLQDTTVCKGPKPVWPQSCNVMFNNLFTSGFVALEWILILVLNCLMLLNHAMKKLKRKNHFSAFDLNVFAINVNDLLFGINILCLFCVDRFYGSEYIIHADRWLRSWFCKILSLLSAINVLSSLYLINLTTVSRFIAVKYPFSQNIKSKILLTKLIISGSIFNLGIILVFFFAHTTVEGNSTLPSSICQLIGETTESVSVRLFTILVLILMICSTSLSFIVFCLIFNQLKTSSFIHRNQHSSTIKRLILIVATNSLSWMTSGCIYTVSVVMVKFPTFLLVWNACFINTINSLVNPLIMLIAAIRSSKPDKKAQLKYSSTIVEKLQL